MRLAGPRAARLRYSVTGRGHGQRSDELFLYREVLEINLPSLDGLVRAKRPQQLPVVLTRDEVRAVLERFEGTPRLMAYLLYGAGLRLLECCRLRVQDIDFFANQIIVQGGKGDKDRVTMPPGVVKADLARHLEFVREQHRMRSRAKRRDASTTMIHTHVPNRGPAAVRRPADRMSNAEVSGAPGR